MADYPWFPMFVDLSDKNVLVVGGGTIGGRRAAALARFCPNVEVVSPQVGEAVRREAEAGRVRVSLRPFERNDLEGRDLVLAATDDPALNAAIAEACRGRHIPVNVSSDHALCDFYFPGVVVDGDISVGVTASGRDHRLAREVTQRIRESLTTK